MKKRFLLMGWAVVLSAMQLQAGVVTSPNGKLTVTEKDNLLVINYGQQAVLEVIVGESRGQVHDSAASLNQATCPHDSLTFVRKVTADYTMLAGKRLHCTNEANEYRKGSLVVRLYNDGLAFRYELTSLQDAALPKELTAYRIPEGTKRWIQQWTDAYEGFFPLTTSYKTLPVRSFSGTFKSADGWNMRWGYPALLEPADGIFALITEANIERRQSASCLYSDGEIYRVVPDQNELKVSGDWHSPWRVAIIGRLSDIVESTLVTDVSEPCQLKETSWIEPGVVSWIYWAYNHGSNDYNIIKKYIDMAATLRLPYMLIDAEWDTMKDGKTVEDAVAYAKSKGVKPMIWYNSSVGWVDGAPTPKYRLNKPEDREKEFAWCEKIGVAGVKIDFFSGDNQMNMDYCLDLLESAARHHLLVNFHGATIPRGWQRTYPHLLSTEGVYGAEWYNNVPTFTKQAACHNATLPFTRNVIGPMDYTPCAFSDSQHPHITTNGHELALTVLYESGLQHLADKPESYFAQPKAVQDFLSTLPVTWDETRLLSGYPGEWVVVARRHGETWYVAGINGTDEIKDVITTVDIKAIKAIQAFYDSGNQAEPWDIRQLSTHVLPDLLRLQPRGGFVWKITIK